jgi:predicted acetyltransferase
MIELVRPTVDLADSWWAMVDDFAGETIHGSSYRAGDREVLRDPEAFEEWVDWIGRMERAEEPLPEGRVPSSNRWIVRDGRVVGTIAVRHALTPSLLVEGGHIGYAVGPRWRRQGVARAALGLGLGIAASRGIDPVLVTCDTTNTASARTIASCGGVLEDERDGVLRHWIRTHAAVPAISLATLQTQRVELPLITPDEAAAMRAGERHPLWAPDYPREDDLDAIRTLESVSPWSARHVVRRSDGLVVGSVGCFGPPSVDGLVEIGYGLVESARGSGLMTEIVAVLAAAIEAGGASVMAHTAPDNTPSHRVLQRLGFRHEGEDGGEWRWCRARVAAGPPTDSGPVSVP